MIFILLLIEDTKEKRKKEDKQRVLTNHFSAILREMTHSSDSYLDGKTAPPKSSMYVIHHVDCDIRDLQIISATRF
jgi:hypothetical protein